MRIIELIIGKIKTNTYIVFNEGNTDAIVIDPAGDYQKIKETASKNGVTIKAVLITHAHFDHVNAVADFQRDGARVYLHKDDIPLIHLKDDSFKALSARVIPFEVDVELLGEESLFICGLSVKVLHTPGHSNGSVCYVIGDTIFSGDTLFYLDVGSTRFVGGSEEKLKKSIRDKLFKLEGNFKILPGHGISTTLEFEKAHNIYV